MQIAVLGAGFCGLAVTWHLLQKGVKEITLFDPLGIGKGASGVAAGLLHPYAGSQAKKNLRADEGLKATHQLLEVARKTLDLPIILSKGLIRLAVSDEQKKDFALVASQYPDVHWLDAAQCSEKLGHNQPHPGILIDSAVAIDCERYLHGLWTACAAKGVQFEKKAVPSLEELEDFDQIIVTMGAAAKALPELSSIQVTPIKGQVIELNWPQSLPPLNLPISSQAYVLMQAEGKRCIAGATFERHFDGEGPDLLSALKEIMPKLQAFLPEITSSMVVGCRAGVRASAPKHQPLVAKIDKKSWLLTGMGSKGLLYHALYADELTSQIVASL